MRGTFAGCLGVVVSLDGPHFVRVEINDVEPIWLWIKYDSIEELRDLSHDDESVAFV